MSRLAKESLLERLTTVKLIKYEPCLADKVTINPFIKATSVSTPIELIQSNIDKPMNVKAR